MKNLTNQQLNATFAFFQEIGIIGQLSRALFEAQLPAGFQVIHFSVLNNLSKSENGKSPSELASAFQVARSHMSDILEQLDKHAYINFAANPKDKRSKFVKISAKGKRFRESAIKRFGVPAAELANNFDLAKLDTLMPTLIELRKVMDEARN